MTTNSVLDAIKDGNWNFEPREVAESQFNSTEAMPGTIDKLDVLAERVQAGLPLWHSCDKQDLDARKA